MEGKSGNDIRCNRYKDGAQNNEPAPSVRTLRSGQDITMRWETGEEGQDWPTSHMGPVITYMAHCDNDDCTTFQADGNVWFKVDEAGYDASQFDENEPDAESKQVNCWASTTMYEYLILLY